MKDKLLIASFMIVLCSFMILSLFMPDRDISLFERRKLAQFPAWDTTAFLNGEYMDQLDRYVSEQFPFRDSFRKLKGYVSQSFFLMNDQNGIFIRDNALYELHPALDEASIQRFIRLIQQVKTRYIQSKNVYFAIIPDKSDYLETAIPKWDYETMKTMLRDAFNDFVFIDLYDSLNLDSYYASDLHWRQEALSDVVKQLRIAMHLSDYKMPQEKQCYDEFYGSYYGRIAHHLKPDTLCYLTNDEIEAATVYDYEKQIHRRVYETEDFSHVDAYDVFLGGAKPLLIIENKQAQSDRELILFRDSFGSSLAPLFIPYYSKITMIDLRYLSSAWIEKIDEIEFHSENQDILFLYSAGMINQSNTMK